MWRSAPQRHARGVASAVLLLLPSPVMVATTPLVRSNSKMASCSWASSTLRSLTDGLRGWADCPRRQVVADVFFQGVFVVQGHGESP